MTRKDNKGRIYNSPLIGLISLVVLNLVVIFLLTNISRYIAIQRQLFLYAMIAIIALVLIANILFAIGYGGRKKLARKMYLVVTVILVIVIGIGTFYTGELNKGIDGYINMGTQEVSEYSFITLNEGQTLDNLFPETRLGYVSKDDDYNKAIEAEIEKHSMNVDIVVYDTYQDLFHELLNKKDLDVAIVPKQFTRYAENFEEDAQELLATATIISSFDITSSVDEATNAKVLEDPFTILMMGLNDNLADSIILITVNPKTLHVTMTSIARDLYVPIACYSGQTSDKLNHSRGRSRQCMIDTIENLLEINIDFYFETDFFAMIKIVDVLGGLELEVPHEFGRMLPIEGKPGEREWVEVPAGINVLNGKQVLNFARERKTFGTGDFQRQLNQQYVLKELALKIINESKKNINTLINVIKAADNNITMNLGVEQDLSPLIGFALNNIAASPVDPMGTFVIHNSQISGDTPMINGRSVIVPFKKSLEDNKKIIHDNLSTEIAKPSQKRFTFSANNPHKFEIETYSSKYWGTPLLWFNTKPNKPTTPTTPTTPESPTVTQPSGKKFVVPVLTVKSLEEVLQWGKDNGVAITQRKIESSEDKFNHHQVIHQVVEAGEYDVKPESIEVSVIIKLENPTTPEKPATPETPTITVPTFKTIKEALVWGEKHDVYIILNPHIESNDYENYVVIKQMVTKQEDGVKLKSITLSIEKKSAE